MDWNNKVMIMSREQGMTWYLKGWPVAYLVPEEEALEANLSTRFSKILAKKDQNANDQSIRVKKLSALTRVPTKG